MNPQTQSPSTKNTRTLILIGAVAAVLHFMVMLLLLHNAAIAFFWMSILAGLGCALVVAAKRAFRSRAGKQTRSAVK
jgi:Flp pilus assembly protein TadB